MMVYTVFGRVNKLYTQPLSPPSFGTLVTACLRSQTTRACFLLSPAANCCFACYYFSLFLIIRLPLAILWGVYRTILRGYTERYCGGLPNCCADKEIKKIKSKESVSPSIDDVISYCRQMSFTFSPERFFNYYDALGWEKNGQPILNWKKVLSGDQKAFQG